MEPPILLLNLENKKKKIIWELKDYNFDFGIIKKESLEKAKEGDIIESHIGKKIKVLKPYFIDFIEEAERGPQITHPKDIGIIISYTGISDGWKVLEIGAGSGILTMYLANSVKPNGKVFSYEKRKEFYEIAKRNLERTGLIKYVDLKLKDGYEFEEKELDMIVTDIPRPWEIIEKIYNSLKSGGFLVSLFPNMTSVKIMIENIKEYDFFNTKIYEVFIREWISDKKVLKPVHKGILHTEFIILTRKA